MSDAEHDRMDARQGESHRDGSLRDRGHDTPDAKKGDADRADDGQDKSHKDESDKDGGNGGDKEKKPSLFSKPLFWIALVVVVALLVVGGTLYWLHERQFESTDDAFVDAHIVRIASQSSGRLIQVANLDNRHVDAGRLLAVVEPTGPQAQLGEANANVVQAQAQVEQARAQVAAAIANQSQAAAASLAPLAAADKAAQDLARYNALLRLDPNAVAGQQLDQARSQARSTLSDAVAARRQIANAAANVQVAKRQIGAAQAVVTARKSAVDQARVTLGDLRLTAPVSGQVVNRQVNLGSYVAPGTQLMAIVPDRMWVTANFKETQLTLMKIGQPVTIQVDAYPNVAFRGHIDSVQRGAGQAFALLPPQNATGNYVKVVQRVPVRIVFDTRNGPDPRRYPIGPGMSVTPVVKVR